MTNVLCIGCGMMGSQLIQAFLEEGHAVTVVNRTAAKAAPYVAQGAGYFPTLAQAVRQVDAELIVINVSDYDVSLALLDSAPEAVRGRIVVNLSTGAADKVAAFAARVSALWMFRSPPLGRSSTDLSAVDLTRGLNVSVHWQQKPLLAATRILKLWQSISAAESRTFAILRYYYNRVYHESALPKTNSCGKALFSKRQSGKGPYYMNIW